MTQYQRQNHFKSLSLVPSILAYKVYDQTPEINFAPKRKSMDTPYDDGSFIKPLKQSFVKNPRLMPMTRLMLSLLSGWNGKGQGGIETTTGTIAKHLNRSSRMVFNYLKDAMEEGYLSYTRRKDRMGYYIGIKIILNFGAIRRSFNKRKTEPKTAENRDRNYTSEINYNLLNTKEPDTKIMDALARFAANAGYLDTNTVNKPPS